MVLYQGGRNSKRSFRMDCLSVEFKGSVNISGKGKGVAIRRGGWRGNNLRKSTEKRGRVNLVVPSLSKYRKTFVYSIKKERGRKENQSETGNLLARLCEASPRLRMLGFSNKIIRIVKANEKKDLK